MHIHKKTGFFSKIPRFLGIFLPIIFWGSALFAFDAPYVAFSTLIAAAVHEGGHLLAFRLLGQRSSLPAPKLFGFGISGVERTSYGGEILCAAAGPLMNFLLPIAALPLRLLDIDAYSTFAIISVTTGLSNLMPIKGYDGYRILSALVSKISDSRSIINIIDAFSFILITGITFFSLYLIGKLGEGYWIFFVFFFSLISEMIKKGFPSRI